MKQIVLLFIGLFSALSLSASFNFSAAQEISKSSSLIALIDNGLVFENISSQAGTVGEFLEEQKISIKEGDNIIPSLDNKIFSGLKIIIQREKEVVISVDKKKIENHTLLSNVEGVLWENGVSVSEDDITSPARLSPLSANTEIKVTRVIIKEEVKKENINFKTITQEDEKLSWRTRKVTQKGEKGIKELRYRVVLHNEQEISRKLLETQITKEPVSEIAVQGTYVKVGKSHTGAATWYSFRGGLFAASPWLPMGSYARVTNKENGKQVIVKINDRGPFGDGRIIDLDKVAFSKIAPLGQGVISVKVEEIIN